MIKPIKPKKYLDLQDMLKTEIIRIRDNVNNGFWVVGNDKHIYSNVSPSSNNQNWIIYPLGGNIYMFVHMSTGTVLTSVPISDVYGNLSFNLTAESYIGDATQQFTLETSLNNPNYYYIRSLDNGYHVQLDRSNNSAAMTTNEAYDDSIVWFFEAVDKLSISNNLPTTQTLDTFPIYADIQNNLLPDETPDRLISYTLMPAPAIQDNQLTLNQQVQISPYYLMEKHQYWTQLQQLSLAPGQRTEKTYEYGMDTTQLNEMTETTNISVHEDAGLSFSLGGIFGGSASIRKEITDNLVIHESISSKVSSKSTDTSTFDNSSNQYTMYYAKYILTTKLVLKRFGSEEDLNTIVGTWTFTDQNTIRTTSWIPNANPTDCSDCFDGVDCSDCPNCPQCQDQNE